MEQPDASTRRTLALDLSLAAASLVLAGLLVFGTAGLPPPRFEPMGSAALPRILAGVIAVLSLGVAAAAWRARGATAKPERRARPPFRPLAVPVLLVGYVAALDVGEAPFVPATTLFVIAMGLVLTRPTLRTAVAFAVFGVALALLIDGVFTRFLFVDL